MVKIYNFVRYDMHDRTAELHNKNVKGNYVRNGRDEVSTIVEDEILDCGKPVNFTIYDDLIGNF